MTFTTPHRVTPGTTEETSSKSPRRLDDRIPLRLVLAVAALWLASLYVVFGLAPAPTTDPTATAVAIGMAFDLALISTLAGFAAQRRWGLLTSAAGGVVLLVGAGLCSLGGHTGGWLVAQYVTGAAILAVSQAAFRRF